MITNEQYKNGMFSSKTDEWETPQSLFDRLNKIFCFELDAAASDANHKCEKYYTKEQNGLNQSWGGTEPILIRHTADRLAIG